MARLNIEPNHLHKDELSFELSIRGIKTSESQTVDKLRKCLRPLLRLENQQQSFHYPKIDVDVDNELDILKQKSAGFKTLLANTAVDKPCLSLRTRIHHCINRINYLDVSVLSAEQVQLRSVVLVDFLEALDTLDSADNIVSFDKLVISSEKLDQSNCDVNSTASYVEQPDSSPKLHKTGKFPVRKWNVKFTGDTKGFSVHTFLERVNELMVARNVSETELLESAIDLFDGKALMWFRSNRERFTDWKSLSELLIKHYEPPDYQSRLFQDILSRTQDTSESFVDYFTCMDDQPDSDDYSTDEYKRKRGEEGAFFKKSAKIPRTPSKSKDKAEEKTRADEKMDRMLEMMENMTKEVALIRTEQREFNEKLRRLKDENETLKKENEKIKEESVQTKKVLVDLQTRIEFLEKEKRRNNLIISGLKIETEKTEERKAEINGFIRRELNVGVSIKTVAKLGEKTYLIALENTEEKLAIMKNKNKLRHMKGNKVYINNDQTIQEREIQKFIRDRAREERQRGKSVIVKYQRLIIDGKQWKWNTNRDALEPVKDTQTPKSTN
ncbi:retrotransposon gag protein [Holotrichia oblita]|uniref:Retrotransposon gag protein n=1 Tax=Holotrichia oblita TaxID=644536 RepID=A0ACB9T8Z9_HOLOL|nr:retrotransposon gag protein [Holotrichia oblita]